MGEVTALENGDTLFLTDDRDDWKSSIAAAVQEGGSVTVLTGGYETRYAARISYPEGVEHEVPTEPAPEPENVPTLKKARGAKATTDDPEDLLGAPEDSAT